MRNSGLDMQFDNRRLSLEVGQTRNSGLDMHFDNQRLSKLGGHWLKTEINSRVPGIVGSFVGSLMLWSSVFSTALYQLSI